MNVKKGRLGVPGTPKEVSFTRGMILNLVCEKSFFQVRKDALDVKK